MVWEWFGLLLTRLAEPGLQAGESWRNIRERIQEIGLPKWRAERIARTEVIRAHVEGAKAGYVANGIVRDLRWLDGQVEACPVCQELHEQVRKLNNAIGYSTSVINFRGASVNEVRKARKNAL